MTIETWHYPYTPTERQKQAHKSTAEELLFGGAAGGGKSSWLLASAVILCVLVPGAQALVFRRTYPDLKRSLIPRLLEQLPRHVATYNSQDHAFSFANGSRLELSHLQHENDIYNYQGAEAQLVAFDELTQFTESQYKYLLSRVRAGGKVLERMNELGMVPRMIASANPGGIGHHWVKARFIDHGRAGETWSPESSEEEPSPLTRAFIPSLLTDNPHLDQVQYRRQLQALDPILRKALLTGNWDILEGVRFTAWDRAVHVITPETLPAPLFGAPRAVGVDYGLSAPFAALWGALLSDDLVLVYRELYKANLTPAQQAALIRDSERPDERRPERPIPVALDPSTWARNPANPTGSALTKEIPPPGSIAAAYYDVFGHALVKARNERVAGWALLDHHLHVRADGLPRILVHDTCPELIRTLPTMPRDKKNPEDIDTHAEDHLPDALRYLLMELAGKRPTVKPDPRKADRAPKNVTAGLAKAGF